MSVKKIAEMVGAGMPDDDKKKLLDAAIAAHAKKQRAKQRIFIDDLNEAADRHGVKTKDMVAALEARGWEHHNGAWKKKTSES